MPAWKSSTRMMLRTRVAFFCNFSRLSKRCLFRRDFNRGNRKKLGTERLWLNGGWGSIEMLYFARNWITLNYVLESTFINLPHFKFFHGNMMHNRFRKFQCLRNHSDTHPTIKDKKRLHFSHTVWSSRSTWWTPSALFAIDACLASLNPLCHLNTGALDKKSSP